MTKGLSELALAIRFFASGRAGNYDINMSTPITQYFVGNFNADHRSKIKLGIAIGEAQCLG